MIGLAGRVAETGCPSDASAGIEAGSGQSGVREWRFAPAAGSVHVGRAFWQGDGKEEWAS